MQPLEHILRLKIVVRQAGIRQYHSTMVSHHDAFLHQMCRFIVVLKHISDIFDYLLFRIDKFYMLSLLWRTLNMVYFARYSIKHNYRIVLITPINSIFIFIPSQEYIY